MALHAWADQYTGPACSAKVLFIVVGNITNAVRRPVGWVNEWSISLRCLPMYLLYCFLAAVSFTGVDKGRIVLRKWYVVTEV